MVRLSLFSFRSRQRKSRRTGLPGRIFSNFRNGLSLMLNQKGTREKCPPFPEGAAFLFNTSARVHDGEERVSRENPISITRALKRQIHTPLCFQGMGDIIPDCSTSDLSNSPALQLSGCVLIFWRGWNGNTSGSWTYHVTMHIQNSNRRDDDPRRSSRSKPMSWVGCGNKAKKRPCSFCSNQNPLLDWGLGERFGFEE